MPCPAPRPVPRYRKAVLGLGLIALAAAGCSADDAGTATRPVQLKDGSSVKLALVRGGADAAPRSWQTADKDLASLGLGAVTFNQSSQVDQSKQNAVINSLVAQGYNAFGISGASLTGVNSTFEELKAKGYAVGSLASCPAGATNSADFCLSTDVEAAAYKAAKATIGAMGGEGTLVHLTGATDRDTRRRIAGVQKAVFETNGKVTELPVVTGLDQDARTAQKAVGTLLATKGSDLKGIVATAHPAAVAAAEEVARGNLPIKVVAIDDDAKLLDEIRAGRVAATVVQNPAGQAYVGGWLLALIGSKQCQLKTPGLIIDSGSVVVTQQNVETYDAERKATAEQLRKDLAADLTCE